MTWAWWFLAAWLTCSVLLCGWLWLTGDAEPPEDRETRLGIERSGREAAKGRHPAGKRPPVVDVFDQHEKPRRGEEWDIYIPPSPEVRGYGHGRSVAEAAAADPVRIQLDATFNLPAAQERRTT